jgi:hypothetical protein
MNFQVTILEPLGLRWFFSLVSADDAPAAVNRAKACQKKIAFEAVNPSRNFLLQMHEASFTKSRRTTR